MLDIIKCWWFARKELRKVEYADTVRDFQAAQSQMISDAYAKVETERVVQDK